MKKRTVISFIVFLSVVLLGVSFIVPFWKYDGMTGGVTNLRIMDDLSFLEVAFAQKEVNIAIGETVSYLTIGIFGLSSLYLLLDMGDGKGRLKIIKLLISGISAVASVVMVIMAIVFMSSCSSSAIGGLVQQQLGLGIGLILAMIGGVIGSLVGVFGALKTKK